MEKGQKFLLLRYSNNIVPDTIEKHISVINELGFCWFGKIGVVPSIKIRNAILSEQTPRILLYTKGIAHECELVDISTNRPSIGYPCYYETEGVYPSVYFKLKSITPIAVNDLDNYVIISSGKKLSDAIWHSMTSYFYACWPDEKRGHTDVLSKPKAEHQNEGKKVLPSNDCVFRHNGICTCKSCISYQYECERPSMCIKQKR